MSFLHPWSHSQIHLLSCLVLKYSQIKVYSQTQCHSGCTHFYIVYVPITYCCEVGMYLVGYSFHLK